MLSLLLFFSYQLDHTRIRQDFLTASYIPSSPRLRRFAFGFENIYSDILWLKTIQQFHQRLFKQLPSQKIQQFYYFIVDLDPYFLEAYSFGAIFLAISEKNSLAGIRFLEYASRNIPHEPFIWVMIGQFYRLERFNLNRQKIMSIQQALTKSAKSFYQAIKLGAGKPALNALRAIFRNRLHLFDSLTWLSYYNRAGNNIILRKLLEQRILLHIKLHHLRYLHKHLLAFKQKHHHFPQQLKQLTIAIPKEPELENMPAILRQCNQIIQRGKNTHDIVQQLRLYLISPQIGTKDYAYENKTGKIKSVSYFSEDKRLSKNYFWVKTK